MTEAGEQATGNRSRLIFLVGFMGAGKTTVGRELAGILGLSFFDLDEVIERRAGATIKEIFASAGESEFRRMESQALSDCLSQRDAVIALGGGAFVSRENRELIKGKGFTIWLDCPLETCLKRVGADRARPLLASREEMSALLEARTPAYAEADYRIDCRDRSPAEIAGEIASLIFA